MDKDKLGELGSFCFRMRAQRCCLQPLIGGCREDETKLPDMCNERTRKSQHGKLFLVRVGQL